MSSHSVTFTPVESFLGGLLLGVGVSANLLLFGRVTGFSGILGEMIRPSAKTHGTVSEQTWRFIFLGGMIIAGVVSSNTDPKFPTPLGLKTKIFATSGLLVGFGIVVLVERGAVQFAAAFRR